MTNEILQNKNHFTKKIVVSFLDWFMHMIAYALVLVTASIVFKKTIYIDSSHFGLWCLLAAVIIYFLNKTVKPLIVWLTLPITGLTLGLFYPFINVIILNLADFVLGSHFHIHGIFMSFMVAIFISFLNVVMDMLVIEPIIKRGE